MNIKEEAYQAATEFLNNANIAPGALVVIGCSTSEVENQKVGTSSDPQVAKDVFAGIYEAAKEHGVQLAAQCCEHLNRALVVERSVAKEGRYEEVGVIPWPKAGGSFATIAYQNFSDPVVVEHIKADAGMDIGDTLIGMHLKDVAVPFRLTQSTIGAARVVCAYTRPKLIGGERAHYHDVWTE